MDHLRSRLAIIGTAILLTLAFGTAGFVLIEDYPLFDAFYMALITVTTVGYGEIHPLSQAGRLFNSVLILFGVTTMLLAVGGMTQTIIELELNQYFGKRRIKAMIEKLTEHYIVCGFGRVGRGAAFELQRAKVPLIIIDRNENRVEQAIRAGMLAVVADANRDATLREAGIARAKGLVATLPTDADNLFLTLSARTLNPEITLCARVADEEAEDKFRRAGADFVYAPYVTTGTRMAQSLLRPHVTEFLAFTTTDTGLNVGIEQVLVGEASQFAHRTLEEVRLRRELGVIVLAIRKADGNMLFNPPAEAELAPGDFLVVMGEPAGLRRLEQLLTGAAA